MLVYFSSQVVSSLLELSLPSLLLSFLLLSNLPFCLQVPISFFPCDHSIDHQLISHRVLGFDSSCGLSRNCASIIVLQLVQIGNHGLWRFHMWGSLGCWDHRLVRYDLDLCFLVIQPVLRILDNSADFGLLYCFGWAFCLGRYFVSGLTSSAFSV